MNAKRAAKSAKAAKRAKIPFLPFFALFAFFAAPSIHQLSDSLEMPDFRSKSSKIGK
ncbi:MAG: hypothetical protein ACREEM_19465 [Blastocatellia bacterium]